LTPSSGEPVALVFALVSEQGGCCAGYFTLKQVEDRNTLFISRGVKAIEGDYIRKWAKGHDG
jgi:histidinol phosphatase-like enzyme